jgi:4-hydroxy-L-threonine phosphate dehydrogenase PdxA
VKDGKNNSDPGPLILVTMGDPAGIGPEITLKALSDRPRHDLCRLVVVGDYSIMAHALRIIGSDKSLHCIEALQEWEEQSINILDMHSIVPESFTTGMVHPLCGRVWVCGCGNCLLSEG